MKEPKKVHSPEYIRSISEKVYRAELARSAGGSDQAWKNGEADRMIAKYNADGEDGQARFSRNAGQYDHLTRAYLEALEIEP